jgi:hypothetical protein
VHAMTGRGMVKRDGVHGMTVRGMVGSGMTSRCMVGEDGMHGTGTYMRDTLHKCVNVNIMPRRQDI